MEVTGSRIPKRSARSPSEDGIKVLTRESLEQMQTGGHGAPTKGDATR